MKKSTSTLLIILLFLCSMSYAYGGEPENLLGVSFNYDKKEITIKVVTTGCTSKEDFQFQVKENSVTIIRNKKDECKALAEEVSFTYTLKEAGIDPNKPFKIVNNFMVNPYMAKIFPGSEASLPLIKSKFDPKLFKEITTEEYTVFSDFFNTKSFSGIDVPQFFEDAYKARVLFEKTTALEKKETDSLNLLRNSLGDGILELVKDFKQKNDEQLINGAKMQVNGLSIFTKKNMEDAQKESQTLREVPSRRMSDIIHLSRIGFNQTKNQALFYLLHSGSPRTSYWVLMEKTNNKWVIKKAVMDNMIIF